MDTNGQRRVSDERFRDRKHAGLALADRLSAYTGEARTLVLALPRGGVPVAAEVAHMIGAPLDVLIARKIGVPHYPELAMGAIAGLGDAFAVVENGDILNQLGLQGRGDGIFALIVARERDELLRRERLYRGSRAPLSVTDRTVIIVDDGLATGATMRAAIAVLRQLSPARLVAAVPVGSPQACETIADLVDEFVCVLAPDPFHAVGQGYLSFTQTTDDEVVRILHRHSG